jgi:hypothetical protein
MSRILRMPTVIVTLAFAAMSVAQAHSINYRHDHFHAGYAGPMYSQTPRARRDGYDGSRYWWGGECWPTDAGGCDWQ